VPTRVSHLALLDAQLQWFTDGKERAAAERMLASGSALTMQVLWRAGESFE
jgi:hypothetical protein